MHIFIATYIMSGIKGEEKAEPVKEDPDTDDVSGFFSNFPSIFFWQFILVRFLQRKLLWHLLFGIRRPENII